MLHDYLELLKKRYITSSNKDNVIFHQCYSPRTCEVQFPAAVYSIQCGAALRFHNRYFLLRISSNKANLLTERHRTFYRSTI